MLHSTKAKAPKVFTTRWAMSYLAGPLSREQVTTLTADSPERQAASTPTPDPVATPATQEVGATPVATPVASPVAATGASTADDETPVAPSVPDNIRTYYLDPSAPWAAQVRAVAGGSRYEAAIVARVDLVFDDQHADLSHQEEWEAVFFPLGASFDPETAISVDYDERDLKTATPAGVQYALTDLKIDTKTAWTSFQSDIKNWLYQHQSVTVFKNPTLKLYSRVGETEEAFKVRCLAAAEDASDIDVAKLKDKYKARIKTVKDQLRTAERRVQELEVDVSSRKQTELISGAGALLGALLGGKGRSRSLSGVANRRSQTRRTNERLDTAMDKVDDKLGSLDELEDELADDLQAIVAKWDDAAGVIETLDVGLEKTDMRVEEVSLVCIPTA